MTDVWEAPWPEPDAPPPEGALAELPAAPLRQVVATYMARDGATAGEAARAMGLDPHYVLGVLAGEVAGVDARTVRRVSDRLDLAPEDIWGGEAGAGIGWVYGDLCVRHLEAAPPAPPEPGWPPDAPMIELD